MMNLHLLSANITILISIVMFVISTCYIFDELGGDKIQTAKKLLGSFFTGVLMSLGISICGLSMRSRLFEGLTFGGGWDAYLLIFIATVVVANTAIYHLTKKYPLVYAVANNLKKSKGRGKEAKGLCKWTKDKIIMWLLLKIIQNKKNSVLAPL